MDSLNPVEARATRVIYQDENLVKPNSLPISYKRRLLLLMYNVLPPVGVVYCLKTPRVKYKVGKESAQYRGPVIWNFINRFINFNANVQKEFQKFLRRLSQNINSFSFKAPMMFLSITTLYHSF